MRKIIFLLLLLSSVAFGRIGSETIVTGSTHDAVTLGTANGLSLGGGGQELSLQAATAAVPGALSAADWATFNGKQDTITNPVTGTGANTRISFWDSASSVTSDADFLWDLTNNILTAPNIKSSVLYPAADSTTAFQLRKADGATNLLTADSTNSRIIIGTGALTTSNTSQLQVKGIDNGQTGSRTAMTFGDGGFFNPSNAGSESNGDKWVFWNRGGYKGAIGFASYEMWFQSTGNNTTNKFRFYGGATTTPVEVLAFGSSPSTEGFIWNDTGLDLNFRVEGDTDANLIKADAGLDYVGIGVAAPASKLHINGAVQIADTANACSATTAGAIKYYVSGNTSNIDACMQTGAATWAWTQIKQNTW